MAPPRKTAKDDFQPDVLLAETAQTKKEVSEMDERISKLEELFESPQNFAKMFEEHTKDSRSMTRMFSGVFCEMMKDDEAVKNAIKDRVEMIDRGYIRALIKRGGVLLWSLALIFITAIISGIGTLMVAKFAQ